jgi:hypothetical protein
MSMRSTAQLSIGTLLRCITFVAVFFVIAELVYRTQEPIAQKSLRFCWSAMGVGALIYLVFLLSPKAPDTETIRFRLLQAHRSRLNFFSHVALFMCLSAAIVVGVSIICILIADNRKNRGPFPVSSTMFGAFAGFYVGGLLLNSGRQWVLLTESRVEGPFRRIYWENVQSAFWFEKERGVLSLVRVCRRSLPIEPINVEVPERIRDSIEQFLRTKTQFVD